MVNSNIWGQHAWKFMHYVTLGYPENPTVEQKNNYKNFFISLKNILPCSICAKHYEENLNNLPLTDDILSSKDKLIKWCIDLHNIVNKMLNKTILSYDYAYNLLLNNNNISNYDNINDSNYANYSKIYDNNIEKYYQKINEQTSNNKINESKSEKISEPVELINNKINYFNPLILLIILSVLILIAIILKKK